MQGADFLFISFIFNKADFYGVTPWLVIKLTFHEKTPHLVYIEGGSHSLFIQFFIKTSSHKGEIHTFSRSII